MGTPFFPKGFLRILPLLFISVCLLRKPRFPVIYLSFTGHLPVIYRSFTCHFPVIFLSFSCHFPVIFLSFTCHLPAIYLSFTGHLPAIYRFSFFQDFIAGTVSPKATTRFPPKCQVFPTLHQPRQDLGNLDPFMPNFLILTTGLARGTPRNRIMG